MEREQAEGGGPLRVERFRPGNRADFDRLHSAACGAGWCHCVAWWTDDWDSWGARTAEQNAALRGELCARGEYDGYLAWRAGATVGWCQVGPRDRLAKLTAQFELAPAPDTFAVSCLLVAPAERRRGVARGLLQAVLADLPHRGARRVEAFPRRAASGGALDELELWNGPEALFRSLGFRVVRDDPRRPVLALDF